MEEDMSFICEALYECGGAYLGGNYDLSREEFIELARLSSKSRTNAFKVHQTLTHASWFSDGDMSHLSRDQVEAIEGYLHDGNGASISRIAAFKDIDYDAIRENLDHSKRELDKNCSYKKRRMKACLYTSRSDIRKKVFVRDGKFCKHCESKENLSMDHIIPVSKGGENSLENLQVLCKSCNSRKGNR